MLNQAICMYVKCNFTMNDFSVQNCGSYCACVSRVGVNMLTAKEYVLLVLAVLARIILTNYGQEQLGRKVEASTPLTSWSNGAY